MGLPDPNDPDLVDPPDLANTAFGPQRRLGMREILGYAPIEPDGSVMVKVPANVPFSIEVLDSAGRRLGGRHDNWLQVRAGETLECNGCHAHPATGTPLPHGRSDLAPTAVNQGAGVGMPPSLPWPLNIGLDTDPNIFAENGDTMAPQSMESRLRFSPYIEDAWVLAGPLGAFVSAIIIINYDNVSRWAGQKGVAYTNFVELSQAHFIVFIALN